MSRPQKFQPPRSRVVPPKSVCDADPSCCEPGSQYTLFPCLRNTCPNQVHDVCSTNVARRVHSQLQTLAGPISLNHVCSRRCVVSILSVALDKAPRKSLKKTYHECAARTLEVLGDYERPPLSKQQKEDQKAVNEKYPPSVTFREPEAMEEDTDSDSDLEGTSDGSGDDEGQTKEDTEQEGNSGGASEVVKQPVKKRKTGHPQVGGFQPPL